MTRPSSLQLQTLLYINYVYRCALVPISVNRIVLTSAWRHVLKFKKWRVRWFNCLLWPSTFPRKVNEESSAKLILTTEHLVKITSIECTRGTLAYMTICWVAVRMQEHTPPMTTAAAVIICLSAEGCNLDGEINCSFVCTRSQQPQTTFAKWIAAVQLWGQRLMMAAAAALKDCEMFQVPGHRA